MDNDDLMGMLNGAGGDDVYGMDRAMLGSMGNAGGAGAGAGGGGKAQQPPEKFVSVEEACAMLAGLPPPDSGDDVFDTSCDELEDLLDRELDEERRLPMGYSDEDADMDEPRGFNAPPPGSGSESAARARASEVAMDELFGARAHGGGGGGRRRGRRRPQRPAIDPRLNCFGCKFSSRVDARDMDKHINGDKMNSLLSIFSDGFGHSDERVNAKMCHFFFVEEIWRPLRKKGIIVPIWRTREIYDHFKNHQLDPRLFVAAQIKEYKEISTFLTGTIAQQTDGGSRVKPNEKNIASKLRCDQHLLRLYSTDCSKMNFHNPACTIDFAKAGALMAPYRDFKTMP